MVRSLPSPRPYNAPEAAVTGVPAAVAALRGKAADIVGAEVRRLRGRLPEMEHGQRFEVVRSLHRVADELLGTPADKATKLAASPGGDSYLAALTALFDLDTPIVRSAAAVSRPKACAIPTQHEGAEITDA